MIIRDFENILESRISNPLNFVQVLIGPRQVGKTTGVSRIFEKYSFPKHFATADSPSPYGYEWLNTQWNIAREMGSDTLLVIDEIQKVDNWPETCKLLFDQDRPKKNLKVILLGSASLSIQEGLISSFAGRFELIHAPHWSYEECKNAFNWDLNTYLKFGGYPAAADLINEPARWQSYVLNSIIEPVLGRDISGIVRINNPALFRQAFRLAMSYPAQVISYQKLLGQLQDKGNAATIKHYLELIEGAYLLKKLEKFSGSTVMSSSSSPKLLSLAPALSNAYIDDLTKLSNPDWLGHIFECVVGASLLKLPGKLYYWSYGDYEVDFIRVVDNKVIAYEVKSGLTHKAKSLQVFKKKYPDAEIKIIDKDSFFKLANSNI